MRSAQQGVSMIEVLITIAVMSFGFLSLASFQLASLKHLSGSNQDYVATMLASSMGESIRANIDNLDDYDNADTSNFTKDCTDMANPCTLAESDVWIWKQALADHALPLARGEVELTGNSANVSIHWLSGTNELSYRLQVPL